MCITCQILANDVKTKISISIHGKSMRKSFIVASILALICQTGFLSAHCQMPCGIYHDEMVFNQIDQYIETMYKGVTELKNNKFSNVSERNNFIRWIILKESSSDEIADLITQYFLQQKIKPGEPDTVKRLLSAHKLLFELTAIKQNVELKMVEDFADEWENFKQMFHVLNYECQIDIINRRKRERNFELKKQKETETPHSHDGGPEHTH